MDRPLTSDPETDHLQKATDSTTPTMSRYRRRTSDLDDGVERIAPTGYHANLRARRALRNLEEDIAYKCVSICQSYHDIADGSTPATPLVRRTSRRVHYDDMPVMVESGRDVYLGASGEFSALPRTVIPPRTSSLSCGKHPTSNRIAKTSLGIPDEEDTPSAYNNIPLPSIFSPATGPYQAALRNSAGELTPLPSTFSPSPSAASSSIRPPPATRIDDDGEANLVQLDRKMALMQLRGQMSRRGATDDDFYEWLKTPAGRRAARLSKCAPAPLRIRKRGPSSELPTSPESHSSFLEAEEDENDEIFRTLLQAVRERPGSARDRSLTAALAIMSQPLRPLVDRDLSTIDGSFFSFGDSTSSPRSLERTPPSSPPEPDADPLVSLGREITLMLREDKMHEPDTSTPTTQA